MNTIGNIFRLTSFGESHGSAIGGIIDGVPAGLRIDIDDVQRQLDRRRPGQSDLTTSRNESDKVEFLSGIFEGVTIGTPIGFIVKNSDHHSADYDSFRDIYRPSHADYVYDAKYGRRDHRGGGRSSARETISRVVAGAIACQALSTIGISIKAYTSQVGNIRLDSTDSLDFDIIDSNKVRCPNQTKAVAMERLIEDVKKDGDTVGCVIDCIVDGCPAGFGEPVFGKLSAELASAMMSINAAKGFEIGDGFDFADKKGSEVADVFVNQNGKIATKSNHSGGIQGGISNGQPITMRVAFKPIATLLRPQPTIDKHGNPSVVNPKGRHDPCVAARAVPIVEAMAAIVIFDAYLRNLSSRIDRG